MKSGNLLRALGDLSGAAAAHRAALGLPPERCGRSATTWRALQEDCDAEAEEHFKYALDLSPPPATVDYGFADTAASTANCASAFEQFQSALALGLQLRRAQIGLARPLMRSGQREQALREFANLSTKVHTDTQLVSALATVQ